MKRKIIFGVFLGLIVFGLSSRLLAEGNMIVIENKEREKWKSIIEEYFEKEEKLTLLEYLNENETYKKEELKLKDIKSNDWFYKDVEFLAKLGIVKGKDKETTYKPNEKLTRAEMAAVLSRISYNTTFNYYDEEVPKDLEKTHWAFNPLMKLKMDGTITGYEDGTIKPNKLITRAELVSIMDREIGETENKGEYGELNFKDVKKTDWYYNSLKKVAGEIGISGYEDGTFRPNENVTRAEMAVIISRYMNKTE